jgi:DNA end-binding protein Ku
VAKSTAKSSSRPVWTGSISFGLVTIPVKLFVAVREKTLHFRTLHDQDQMPLKQKMVCSGDGKEVHREHMVKGYEVEKDHFVVVRQDELDAIAPKATKAIEIQDFVELSEIDPLFFDRS